MRQLTLTLVLVGALLIAAPVAAQEAPTMSFGKTLSSWIERIDHWMLEWSDKIRLEKAAQSETTNSQDDDNPVEPPTGEVGPFLEPHG